MVSIVCIPNKGVLHACSSINGGKESLLLFGQIIKADQTFV